MYATVRRSRPTAEQVLALLRDGHTCAQVERLTGWPAGAIRRYADKQPSWLVGTDGRVIVPAEESAPAPAYAVEVVIAHPRPADVLLAELLAQKEELDMPWRDVLEELQMSESLLDRLRHGEATTRTRQRIEAWLVYAARKREAAA